MRTSTSCELIHSRHSVYELNVNSSVKNPLYSCAIFDQHFEIQNLMFFQPYFVIITIEICILGM